MYRPLVLVLILLFTVSCSKSSTNDDVDSVQSMELVGVDESDALLGDSLDDRMVIDSSEEEDGGVFVERQAVEEELVEEAPQESVSLVAEYKEEPMQVDTSQGYGQYTVKSNETLMLISFKLYGDYSRWNEIASLNQDKILNSAIIRPGTKLKYSKSGSDFSWNPQGNPYLIKQHDTLSKISSKVYGTSNRWKPIWKNNSRLIKNPDKIFSGFTIYYPESIE